MQGAGCRAEQAKGKDGATVCVGPARRCHHGLFGQELDAAQLVHPGASRTRQCHEKGMQSLGAGTECSRIHVAVAAAVKWLTKPGFGQVSASKSSDAAAKSPIHAN